MQCINKKCTAEIIDSATFCHICGKRQVPEPKKHIKRANNTGTVYKLSGRRRRPWVAAMGKTILGYFETKTAAQEVVNGLVNKTVTDHYNITFKEVFELWKLEHFKRLTGYGKEGYETAYTHFGGLYNEKFRELRTSHYQPVFDAVSDQGRKRPTLEKMKQLASQLSQWGMREEIIATNYAQFIRLPEAEKTEKETFTVDEIKKLKASTDDAAKLVTILIYTGMRIGELLSLETDNVFVNYCIGGEKTEAGRDRIIPIPHEARSEMAYFKAKAEGKPLLIDGYDGNRTVANFRKRDYYGLLETLDISKKSPHSTRHTYASMAVKSGMAPETLQKILGHADYSTTANIYVHADIDALISAAEKIAGNKRVTNKPRISEKQKTS